MPSEPRRIGRASPPVAPIGGCSVADATRRTDASDGDHTGGAAPRGCTTNGPALIGLHTGLRSTAAGEEGRGGGGDGQKGESGSDSEEG